MDVSRKAADDNARIALGSFQRAPFREFRSRRSAGSFRGFDAYPANVSGIFRSPAETALLRVAKAESSGASPAGQSGTAPDLLEHGFLCAPSRPSADWLEAAYRARTLARPRRDSFHGQRRTAPAVHALLRLLAPARRDLDFPARLRTHCRFPLTMGAPLDRLCRPGQGSSLFDDGRIRETNPGLTIALSGTLQETPALAAHGPCSFS